MTLVIKPELRNRHADAFFGSQQDHTEQVIESLKRIRKAPVITQQRQSALHREILILLMSAAVPMTHSEITQAGHFKFHTSIGARLNELMKARLISRSPIKRKCSVSGELAYEYQV